MWGNEDTQIQRAREEAERIADEAMLADAKAHGGDGVPAPLLYALYAGDSSVRMDVGGQLVTIVLGVFQVVPDPCGVWSAIQRIVSEDAAP